MNTMLSESAVVTKMKFNHQRCKRCSGFMGYEMCLDLESDSGYSTCWVLRCIQCGDMIDETILRNRSLLNRETELVTTA